MHYLYLTLLALIVIILQLSFWDLMGLGFGDLEFSLLLVIYAGLRMNVISGGILSYLLGFFFDTLAGAVPGLYGLIYILLFALSLLVARVTNINSTYLTMIYVFIAALAKAFILLGYFQFIADVSLLEDIWFIFLPQALILAVISPCLFRLFARLEVMLSRERK